MSYNISITTPKPINNCIFRRMTSPTYSLTSDLVVPEWASLEVRKSANDKVYVACVGNTVVGYCVFTSGWHFGEKKTSECIDVGSIEYLEVHPDYRRRGIAKGFLDILEKSFPSKSFVVESLKKAYSFYDAVGFTLFFMDYGTEQCTLIRAAGDLIPETLYDLYEMSYFYEPSEHNFLMGCRWSELQKRWIRPGRSYAEELLAVSREPWEIETVAVQTPELQRIALAGEPDVILKITSPDMTITDSLSEELIGYTYDCICAIREHSLCIDCPNDL